MKRLKTLILIVFIAVLSMSVTSTGAYASTLPSGTDTDQIGSEIDNYIEEHKDTTAGLQVLLYDEDGVIYKKNYGYINKEDKVPVDDNSVFEWGSNSKLLVWVSAMQLSEQGKLDLNRDIRDYLPKDTLKLKYDEPITMIDLMNHQAGFEEVLLGTDVYNADHLISLEEAIKKLQPDQVFEPGTVTAYSNYGAALAAYVIQRVSGMDYADYVIRNIFDRLDMNDTAIKADLSDNRSVLERRLQEYGYDTNGKRLKTPNMYYSNIYPCGNVIGTIDDFYKFASALLPGSGKLFQYEKTMNEMYEPTSFYGKSGVHNLSHGFIWEFYGVDVIGHGGNTTCCSTNLMFDPKSKVGMLVMTNQQGEDIYNDDMYELVFGKFADNKLAKEKQDAPEGLSVSSRSVFMGPLRVLRGFDNISYSMYINDYMNDHWWLQEGNTVYFGVEELKIQTPLVIMEFVLLMLALMGAAYSMITSVSCIVHRFRKRETLHPFRKYNYLLANEMSLIAVGIIGVYIFLNKVQDTICPDILCAVSVFLFIMFLILLASTAYAAYKLFRTRPNERKRELVKYAFTIGFSIVVLIFMVYFDIIQFWSV